MADTNTKGDTKTLVAVLIIFGVLFILGAVQVWRQHDREQAVIARCTEKTTATVSDVSVTHIKKKVRQKAKTTGIKKSRYEEYDEYTISYEYEVEGKSYTDRYRTRAGEGISKGSTINISYDPADPKVNMTSGQEKSSDMLPAVSIALGVVGALLIAGGITAGVKSKSKGAY